jgi:predicted membrane metal-binding protein
MTTAREKRLKSAVNWIKTYTGKRIVYGYSKKYGVDKLCAVKELRMIGVEISEEYEKQLINSMEALRQQRLSFKNKRDEKLNNLCGFDSDENFAMILGYTSGGFPYGVTHEEIVNSKFKVANFSQLFFTRFSQH